MPVHNPLVGSRGTRCLWSGAIFCTAMMCMCSVCPHLFCCENMRSIEELSRALGVHGKAPYEKFCRQRLERCAVRTWDPKSKHRQCMGAHEWVHHPLGIEVRVRHATHVAEREGAFAGDAWHRIISYVHLHAPSGVSVCWLTTWALLATGFSVVCAFAGLPIVWLLLVENERDGAV